MEFLADLDFLPTSINSKLRILIYIITLVHVLAVLIWILLLAKNSKKKSNTFESYVE
jgi:hypothetical protein